MAYEYDEGPVPDLIDMLRADGRFMVLFDPTPGEFTETENLSGVRTVDAAHPILPRSYFPNASPNDYFPYDPVRYGYTFDGWRRSEDGSRVEGDYFEVTGITTILEAMWIRYGDAPAATPTPIPGTSPSPTPTATPTPTPSPSAGSPNPTTNPLAISLMIFGAVAVLGIAAFSIINLSMRHTAAVDDYRTNAMRYKRESRLVSMLGIGNGKTPKK